MIGILIYILTICIVLSILCKYGKKELVYLNLKVFLIVVFVVFLSNLLQNHGVVSVNYNERVTSMVKDISILLATAYVFIFGLESKKIFGRSVAEYFSEDMNTMYQVFAPLFYFMILTVLFDSSELLAISLHVALYNLYLFINILNEVLYWNKCKIKDKYINQVEEQFTLLPSMPDETTLSNFLTDIDKFKIFEDERINVDQLYKNRVNKIHHEIEDLTAIRGFEDAVTNQLFKKIINQFIYEKREHAVIKTNYPYYINTFISNLDSYDVSQLLYNKNFVVEGLNELLVIEILFDKIVKLKKVDKLNDVSLYLPMIVRYAIKNRRLPEEDILIVFYSLLYENEMDMIGCLLPKFISSYEELKAVVIIEAIVDWNNFNVDLENKDKFGKIKLDKQLNHWNSQQMLRECMYYLDEIKKGLPPSEVYEHIVAIKKLYAKTIDFMNKRYHLEDWFSFEKSEHIVVVDLVAELFNTLRFLYKKENYSLKEAQLFEDIIKCYHEIKYITDTSENLKNMLNDVLNNRYTELKQFNDQMPLLLKELSRKDGIVVITSI